MLSRLVLVVSCASITGAALDAGRVELPQRHECFMLQRLDAPRPDVSDAAECAVATVPASTFKIPHALIALETGVVVDPHARVRWDGTAYSYPAWQRDHSLDSAVKSSVLWFFRRTAGLIGSERMHASLRALGYARDTFEGDVTTFWLNGDLVVSPEEQLAFLGRLARYEVPASRTHVDQVMSAFEMPPGRITNASGSHPFPIDWPRPIVVHAKTGNATVNAERVSWIVGYVDSNGARYAFVARVRVEGDLPGTAAVDLAARSLNAHRPVR